MVKTIETRKYGTLTFQIDKEDEYLLSKYNFWAIKTETGFYIVKGNGKNKDFAYLHRLIMNAPKGYHVHHKNGDTLDNRRYNLEVLTPKLHSIETSKSNSLLSEEQIKDILTSKKSEEELITKYNITKVILSNIKRGKSYAWACPEIKRELPKAKRRTRKELQEIKFLVNEGIKPSILAKKFNISLNNIYCMRKGTRYKNIVPILNGFTN